MRYKDLRDAAILWLLANAAGLITTGLITISYHIDQPLSGAFIVTSVTAAIATTLIAVASIASAVLGLRQITGDQDA